MTNQTFPEFLYSFVSTRDNKVTRRNGKCYEQYNRTLTYDKPPLWKIRDTFKTPYNYTGANGEFKCLLYKSMTKENLNYYGCHFWDKILDKDPDAAKAYNIPAGWQSVIDDFAEYEPEHNLSRKLILPQGKGAEPCYSKLIFSLHADNTINLSVVYRSCDVAMGLPHDMWVFYNLLDYLFGQKYLKGTSCDFGAITLFFINAHMYENHRNIVSSYIADLEYHEGEHRELEQDRRYRLPLNI